MKNPNVRKINNNPGGLPVIVTWEIDKDGVVTARPDGVAPTTAYHPKYDIDIAIIDAMFPNGYRPLTQDPDTEDASEVQP